MCGWIWLNIDFDAMFRKQPVGLQGFQPTAASQCPEKRKSSHQSSKHEMSLFLLAIPKRRNPKSLEPPLIGTAKKTWDVTDDATQPTNVPTLKKTGLELFQPQ